MAELMDRITVKCAQLTMDHEESVKLLRHRRWD